MTCLLFENGRLSYLKEPPLPEVAVYGSTPSSDSPQADRRSAEVGIRHLRRHLFRVEAKMRSDPAPWMMRLAPARMGDGKTFCVRLDIFVTDGEDPAEAERLANAVLENLIGGTRSHRCALSKRERRREARRSGRRRAARVPTVIWRTEWCLDEAAIEAHLRGEYVEKVAAFVAQLAG